MVDSLVTKNREAIWIYERFSESCIIGATVYRTVLRAFLFSLGMQLLVLIFFFTATVWGLLRL